MACKDKKYVSVFCGKTFPIINHLWVTSVSSAIEISYKNIYEKNLHKY